VLEKLSKSPFLHLFKTILKEESSLLIEGLWDCPKALLTLTALRELNSSILIITGGERQDKLLDDLNYFSTQECLEFLSWETLPSEDIPPSLDIVGKRFEVLHTLCKSPSHQIVVTNLQGCLQKLLPKKELSSHFHTWKKGSKFSFDALPTFLESLGYIRSPLTSDKGQYSIRGGIIDIFPVSALTPYRIEFFDEEIDRIRSFDPISQKSIEKCESLFLSPANELLLLKKASSLVTLVDYFEKPPLVIFDDLLALEDKYVSLKHLPGIGSSYFLDFDGLFESLQGLKQLYFSSHFIEQLSPIHTQEKKTYGMKQALSFEMFQKTWKTHRLSHPFAKIEEFFLKVEKPSEDLSEDLLSGISSYKDHPLSLHFICATESEEASLKKDLEELGVLLPSQTTFTRGYLTSGVVILDIHTACFPYTELSHRYKVRRKKWRNSYHTPASDFHEITPGDLVVHFHNGVGKFLGIDKQKNHLGHVDEFIIIEYANASKFYVPLSQSHLVSRYIGSKEDSPPLHTLGTTKWQTAKAKAEESIVGYAKDLLHMQAQRETTGGFVYPIDGESMVLFEEEFPFIETEDQLRAIAEIKEDMCSKKAMDRLICGDVGYGKTEVAMRAAFKAAIDGGKQVAFLVPTTTLAMQHYDTFKERMANFPIKIKALSRFISPKEIKQTLEELKEGSIDILIGTHRLISKDICFKNLGLLIIDEEQRFGVRAKESLKKIRIGVDCLTLSATPIPRTLHMSMVGAKDLSIINTPPQDRLPIKTIIAESDPLIIKNAILRELSRDGQTYFIHNRVESIYKIQEDLEKLVPSARMKVVHGQMDSQDIDDIFHAFKSGTIDVLIATTLVESGIDIPNANTILIDRADSFGLADLYQLRGRVGRWNRPAYAYFLTPKNRELHELSKKRLQALVETSGFGGGMKLAMRDLEIRGAGDILGVQQSGQISTVGFHLYCKLLKKTIEALKRKMPTSFIETKMEFSFPASLPESYIRETSLRLEIYHRLGEALEFSQVEEILKELEDRFGKPPSEVIWLYHLTRIRIFATQHEFIFLKFEKVSFIGHKQQKDKTVIKKSMFLPQFDDPKHLEEYVSMMLRHQFHIR
jgi:transcription-repair coupling factor (superfamily II helicase)